MKFFGTVLTGSVLFLFVACQTPDKSDGKVASPAEDTAQSIPEALQKVLQAHGSLEQWLKMKALYFEIVKDPQNEKHFIQLQERLDRVEGSNFIMGYDGQEVWMEADTTYRGNAEFYHNLMFYFYAMPFVLADPGINYRQIEPLVAEGKQYPGIAVSYDDGIGASSKDEYLLFYHPETFEMAWLGYTATYFSNERSTEFNWIKYSAWDTFNGLKLPATLTWYNHDQSLPTEPRNSVDFANVKLSEDMLEKELFIGP
jgi:hypothetical protein